MVEVSTRPASPRDLEPIARLYDHYIVHTPITFDLEAQGVEGRQRWFDAFALTGPHQLYVAEDETGLLGYAASQPLRPKAAYATSVETSIYIEPSRHRQGLGRRLYTTLFDALAREDVHRAYAAITLPNPSSVALHERFGFYAVGTMSEVGRKQGRYWDVGWFEKALAEGGDR